MMASTGCKDFINECERRIKELEEEFRSLLDDLNTTCGILKTVSQENDPLNDISSSLEELRIGESAKLSSLTAETDKVASRMSQTIRLKDTERTRLLYLTVTIKDLDELLNKVEYLEEKSNTGELGNLVKVYAEAAQKLKDEGEAQLQARFGKGATTRIRNIKSCLLERLDLDMTSINPSGEFLERGMSEIFKLFFLYIDLGEREKGTERICEKIQKFARQSLDSIASTASTADFRFASKCERVSDFTRGLLQWCFGKFREGSNPPSDSIYAVVSCVFSTGEAALAEILQSFRKQYFSSTIASKRDARELDLLCTETELLTRTILFGFLSKLDEFASNPKESHPRQLPPPMKLFDMLENLLITPESLGESSYNEYEKEYLEEGVKLAISLNQFDNSNVSTCVDDAFFVLQKSLRRAISISCLDVILIILESLKVTLQNIFMPFIQRRARQLYPDQKSGDYICIALNDLVMARLLLERSIDGIRNGINGTLLFTFEKLRALDGPFPPTIERKDLLKVESTLNDLELFRLSLELQQKLFLEQIFSVHVKAKLTACLVSAMKELPTVQKGNNDNCTNSPISPEDETSLLRIISTIETALWPTFNKDLLEENQTAIMLIISKEVAVILERRLLQLQLTEGMVEAIERDARKVATYLADHSELQAREAFQKVNQMLMVLTAESYDAAQELITSQSLLLTESETSLLMGVRVDWIQPVSGLISK